MILGQPSAERDALRAGVARCGFEVHAAAPHETQILPPDCCLFLLCPGADPSETFERTRRLSERAHGAAIVVLAPPEWPSVPGAALGPHVAVLPWPPEEGTVRQAVAEAAWGCLRQRAAVSAEILRALTTGLPQALVGLDEDLRVRLANQSAEALFGASGRPLAGESWPALVGDQQPGGQRLLQALRRAIDSQDLADLRDLPWGQGTLDVHIVPLGEAPPGLGGCVSVLLLAEDTARRKCLEGDSLEYSKMAALGSLISSIAHEINNPLAGIMGYAELLLSGSVPETLRDDLLKIHREADRCRRIVEGLLFFAQRGKARRGPVNLNHLMRETLALVRYDLRVSGISVREDLDPDIGEPAADAHQLQQVFFNLINNARQAMKSTDTGGILTVRTEREGAVVRVLVRDTGPGIPAADLPHVFEPFYTTKEAGAGTGLGLSICSRIVKEHGGRLYATSTEGEGATFVVELPGGTQADGFRPWAALPTS